MSASDAAITASVTAIIVVLSILMAPDAHWVTYLLTGIMAAVGASLTLALLRRR